MARGLQFWVYEVEGLYYLRSETKCTDQLPMTLQLFCIFVFAFAEKLTRLVWYERRMATMVFDLGLISWSYGYNYCKQPSDDNC